MASGDQIKASDLNFAASITYVDDGSGERVTRQLETILNLISKISKNSGATFAKYWNEQNQAVNDAVAAMQKYDKAVDFKEKQKQASKFYQAYQSIIANDSNANMQSLFGERFESIQTMLNTIENYHPDTIELFSLDNISNTFNDLKNLEEIYTSMGKSGEAQRIAKTLSSSLENGSLADTLKEENRRLNEYIAEYQQNIRKLEEERDRALNNSGYTEVREERDALQYKLDRLVEQAKYEFDSFLSANNFSENQFSPGEFEYYFERIADGSMTAKQAIAEFKEAERNLLREQGTVEGFDVDQIQNFIAKLTEACTKIEEIRLKLDDISKNGVKQRIDDGLGEVFNTDEATGDLNKRTEETRRNMRTLVSDSGNIVVVAETLKEAMGSISTNSGNIDPTIESLSRLISALRDLGKLDLNSLDALKGTIKSLGSFSIDNTKIDESSINTLISKIKELSEIEKTGALNAISNLDFNKSFSGLKVTKAPLENLATYLPLIINTIDGSKIENISKLCDINFSNLEGLKLSKTQVDALENLAEASERLSTIQNLAKSLEQLEAVQKRIDELQAKQSGNNKNRGTQEPKAPKVDPKRKDLDDKIKQLEKARSDYSREELKALEGKDNASVLAATKRIFEDAKTATENAFNEYKATCDAEASEVAELQKKIRRAIEKDPIDKAKMDDQRRANKKAKEDADKKDTKKETDKALKEQESLEKKRQANAVKLGERFAKINADYNDVSSDKAMEGKTEAYKTKLAELKAVIEEYKKLATEYEELKLTSKDPTKIEDSATILNQTKADLDRRMKELRSTTFDLTNKSGEAIPQIVDPASLLQSSDAVQKLTVELEKLYGTEVQISEVKIDNGLVSFNAKDATGNIKNITMALDEYNNVLRKTKETPVQQNTPIKDWQVNLGQAAGGFKVLGESIGSFVSRAFTIYAAINQIKQAIETVKTINDDLATVSMTMDITSGQMERFADSVINTAKEMKMSITDTLDISKIYANMQTTPEQIVKLAQPTIMLANASGISTNEASNYVQAVLNQFNMAESEAEHIADVFENISANVKLDFAQGIGTIAQGVETAGNLVNEAGMSFEKFAAIVATTAEETRQEGSQIGNSWKTILSRISKASNVTDEDIDNETLSKASESLHKVGIEVYNAQGEFNNLDSILTQLAQKWNTLSDAQQAEISYNIAATRNRNTLAVALKNYAKASDLATDAMSSQGTAMKNQEIYEDTYTARITAFKDEIQDLQYSLVNNDLTKGAIDLGTGFLSRINEMTDALGGFGVALDTVLGFGGVSILSKLFGFKHVNNGIGGIKDIFSGLTGLKFFTKKDDEGNPIGKIGMFSKVFDAFKGAEQGKGTGAFFKSLGTDFGAWISTTQGALTAAAAGVTVAYGIFKAADDTFGITFDAAYENATEALDKVQSIKTEMEGYESEIGSNKETLINIGAEYGQVLDANSSVEEMIDTLYELDRTDDNFNLSLADKAQLETLRQENEELQRKLDISKEQRNLETIKSEKEVANALSKQATTDYSSYEEYGSLNGGFSGYAKTNLTDATRKNIEAYRNSLDEINRLNTEYNEAKSEAEKKNIETQIKAQELLRDQISATLSESITQIQTLYDGLEGDNSKYANEQRKIFGDLLDSFATINMTDTERSLRNLNKYFSAPGGDALLEALISANVEGRDLEAVMRSLGLSIDDIDGVTIDQLQQYLDEAKAKTESATEATKEYKASLVDLENALSSDNQDKHVNTLTEAFNKIHEQRQNGMTGTDEFQTFAKYVNPKGVKENLDKVGSTFRDQADAIQAAYDERSEQVGKWLGMKKKEGSSSKDNKFEPDWEFDETLGMENFVNDLASKNLWKVAADEQGRWQIDLAEGFKNTQQAADEFGTSVELVEDMLHGLEAYGYDFGNLFFSGEGVSKYTDSLSEIERIAKDIGDADLKNLADSLKLTYDEDTGNLLTELSEEQIVKIKFEYDLAKLKEDLYNAEQQALNEGYSNSQSNAALIASQDKTLRAMADKVGMTPDDFGSMNGYASSLYSNQQSIINAAQEELASGASGDRLLELQKQIIDARKVQTEMFNDLESAFNQQFEVDISTEEGQKEFKNWVSELSEEEIASIVNFEASTDDIESKLENLKYYEGSIKFDADIDGAERTITAIRDVDGNITYTADVDGVTYEVERIQKPDGTYTYKLGEIIAPTQEQVDASIPDPTPRTAVYDIETHGEKTVLGTFKSVNNYKVDNKEIKISVKDMATSTLKSIKNLWDKLQSKEIKLTTTYSSTGAKPQGAMPGNFYNGTAHHQGTAFSRGSWGLKRSEHNALVGELGMETVVSSDGTYRTVGDKGAELVNLRRGDIIFNHKQTEELFKNGYVTSGGGRAKVVYGSAHYEGNAYKLGNRYGNIIPVGSTSTKSYSSSTSSSSKKSAKNTGKASTADSENLVDYIEILLDRVARATELAVNRIDRAIGLAEKQKATLEAISKTETELQKNLDAAATYKAAADKVTGLSDTEKKKIREGNLSIEDLGKDEKKKKAFDKYKDYYEKYLAATDKATELEDSLAELAKRRLENIEEYHERLLDINKSYQELVESRQDLATALGEAINSTENIKVYEELINEQQNYYKLSVQKLTDYEKELEELVNNNRIKVGSDAYLEAQKTINELEKDVYEASKAVIEFKDKLNEVNNTVISYLIDGFERVINKIEAQISLIESRNGTVDESLYQKQIDLNNQTIENQYKLLNNKLEEQANYEVNSERYQELAKEINDIETGIYGTLEANEKLKDSIVALRLKPINDAVESYDDLNDELSDFISLIDEDSYFDKNGALTEGGAAAIALMTSEISNSKKAIADYTKGLEKVQELYDSGLISEEEYVDLSKEYRKGIRDNVKAIDDLSDSLSSMYINQMQAENEALGEIIDKYAEARDRKQSYYEYSKNLKNQQKTINQLKAEIAALEGVNNAYSQAQLKKLRAQLSEEEEVMTDLKRDHANELMTLGDNDLKEEMTKLLEDTEYEIKHNADKQREVVSSMLDSVVDMYSSAYNKINKIIADTGFVASDEFKSETSGGALAQRAESIKTNAKADVDAAVSGISTGGVSGASGNSSIESAITNREDVRKVVRIELSKTSVSVQEDGGSTSVNANIVPADAANKSLKWESSNPSIATVTNGTIKGEAPGSCTVTVSAQDGYGAKATISVVVTAKPKPATTTTTPSSSSSSSSSTSTSTTANKYPYGKASETTGKLKRGMTGKPVQAVQYALKQLGYFKGEVLGHFYEKTENAVKSFQKAMGLKQTGVVDDELRKKFKSKGYASGAKHINKDQLAWTNEDGNEIIYRATDGALLTRLGAGDTVFNHEQVKKLYEMTKYGTDSGFNPVPQLIDGILSAASEYSTHNGNVEIHYDSLLTVNGNVDKEALPGLEEILKKSYKYTTDQMYKDARKSGLRPR